MFIPEPRMWTHTVLVLLFAAVTGISGSASREFTVLHKEYLQWRYEDNPIFATYNGNYEYNDQMESYNMSSFEPRKERADDLLTRLKQIDRSELSTKKDQMSYDVLMNLLQTFVDGYEWRFYHGLNPVHFMEGLQTYPSYLASVMPFDTIGDFENYVARLLKTPTVIDEYIALFREAIRLNRTYHNVSMTLVFDQIDVILNINSTNSSQYYTPFLGKLENKTTISESAKADLRRRGLAAVEGILSAFRVFRDFLTNEYLPNTRTFWGVHGFDKGKEYYAACLKWYLSLDMTPEEVHQTGLDEVERIEGKMKEIMRKQGHTGTVAEYFEKLMNDSRFFFDTGDELLDEYTSMIFDRVEPKLPDFFVNLPGLPIVVRATETDGIGGSYSSGSADGSRPGVFNANVKRPKETPTYTMMALTLHEADPGHHLQISYGLTADLPTFRRNMESAYGSMVPFLIPSFASYTEGWALYAEALGEEMKVYKDDYELMGRYSSEIFRACRLVVDTGLHYYGWDRERAIRYMLTYTSESRKSVEIEIDRYLTIPGQACSYKIGEIKIRELRKYAEDTLGSKFDLKAFHSVILENGAMPLDLMDSAVRDWVKTVSTEQPPGGAPCDATSVQANIWMVSMIALQLYRGF